MNTLSRLKCCEVQLNLTLHEKWFLLHVKKIPKFFGQKLNLNHCATSMKQQLLEISCIEPGTNSANIIDYDYQC